MPGLLAEILAAQLAVAIAIGFAALIGFTVITSTVVETNLLRWASTWADQLEELGAPLYVGDASAALVDMDRFIASYAEVVQVALYLPDGTQVMALDNGGQDISPLPVPDRDLIDSLERSATQVPTGVVINELGGRRFLMHGPIIVESLAGNDLLQFNPETAQSTADLLGFVGLELDFSSYIDALAPRLAAGAALIAFLILAGWAGSRLLLKRALDPLAALQQPLEQLAQGQMDVELPKPRHREIATIVRVLRETIDAVKQREGHLLHLASRDSLTGLFNRHRLMQELADEIERCRDTNRSSALLFIDLDQFKYVNDTGGHAAGDNLLVTAANQISSAVRKRDLVARFGGDEFVVLLRQVKRNEARMIASEVLESMRRITHAEGDRVFHIQCSIGVAIIGSARHGPEEVVSHGDLACQSAKQRGRNRVEVYRISSKQGEQMARDVHWMRRLRESLANDSFALHFQPLMHISTGEIDHYEALLRMQTKDGLIGPASFLPAATRFGLMSTIDFWVIEKAIHSLAVIGPESQKNIRLSVNVSGYAFEETDIASRIKSLLGNYGVPAELLILEVTEHLAVRFSTDTDKRFDKIRDLGCALAIDDFGTGYSSFSYLKRLPVDYLKIDGSFVRNVVRDKVDQCMVRMTAELAREIGLRTVAEFVQGEAALKLMGQYGIDYAQGSYIGRPTPTLAGVQQPARQTTAA